MATTGTGRPGGIDPYEILQDSTERLHREDCEGLWLRIGEVAQVSRSVIDDTRGGGDWAVDDLEQYIMRTVSAVEKIAKELNRGECTNGHDRQELMDAVNSIHDGIPHNPQRVRDELVGIADTVKENVDLSEYLDDDVDERSHRAVCRGARDSQSLEDRINDVISSSDGVPVDISVSEDGGDKTACVLLEQYADENY